MLNRTNTRIVALICLAVGVAVWFIGHLLFSHRTAEELRLSDQFAWQVEFDRTNEAAQIREKTKKFALSTADDTNMPFDIRAQASRSVDEIFREEMDINQKQLSGAEQLSRLRNARARAQWSYFTLPALGLGLLAALIGLLLFMTAPSAQNRNT